LPIKHPLVELTEEQHNALTGNMLGDGHLGLANNSINSELIITRQIKDIYYLKYEMSIYKNFLFSYYWVNDNATPKIKEKINVETGKYYKYCSFATFKSPSFTPYQKLWYPNDKKIVPNNLQLNSQIIAHWFADDGSVECNKLPYRFVVEFHTQGFSQEEVNFLASLLCDRYNEKFQIQSRNGKYKKYFTIKAYDSACREMFKDIAPFLKMDRKRIFDKPESRFWNNPPERQKSIINSFKLKKENIKLFIKANQDMQFLDFVKFMNLISPQGIVYYSQANAYLEPYIKSRQIYKFYDKYNNNAVTIKFNK